MPWRNCESRYSAIFLEFRKGLCCIQGVLREAVQELREQMQRHLFGTYVKNCVACREW
jgi:hypothetical protein